MKFPQFSVVIPAMYNPHHIGLVACVSSLWEASIFAKINVNIIICVNRVPLTVNIQQWARDLQKKTQLPLVVFSSVSNKGYTGSANDGLFYAWKATNPDWYMVINDDAQVAETFFSSLAPVLRQNYDAISCKVIMPRGEVESVGLRYFSTGLAFPRRKDIHSNEPSIFTGTCVLLSRRRVHTEFKKHGYIFNPLLFAYAEDVELSLRIRRDGGKIYISNDALVIHEGSQTAKRGSFFQLYHGYRNLLLVVLLLWPKSRIILCLPLLLVGQVYVVAMSFYKGYWLLWPKMWWWIAKNWKSIMLQRRDYATK